MKKLLSVLFAIAIFNTINAQANTGIVIENKQMSLGNQQSFAVVVPSAKLKDVETLWGKYVTRNTKAKLVNNTGEWVLVGAVEKKHFTFAI
jgi:hypothetical protein